MRRNLGAGGLAVVLLTACGTTTAAEPSDAPCGAPTSTQAAPSGEEILEVDVDERVVADTLDDLAGESEIVVLGRVLRAQDAELVADSEDGKGVQMEHLTIEVQSVLDGDEDLASSGEVTVRQAGRDHGRVPRTNGLLPAQAGQCAVLFLDKTSRERVLTITSTQGQFVVDDEGQLHGADAHGPGAEVVRKIEGMTVEELRAALG